MVFHRFVLLGMGNDLVVRLVGPIDDHCVDIRNIQHFACLQAVEPEVLDGNYQLNPLLIWHDNVFAFSGRFSILPLR